MGNLIPSHGTTTVKEEIILPNVVNGKNDLLRTTVRGVKTITIGDLDGPNSEHTAGDL